MQVEAIYNQGRLEFKTAIKIMGDHFPVTVELPDDQVVAEPEATASGASGKPGKAGGAKMLAEIRAILGPLHHKQSSVSVAEDKAAYQEALAEKYLR